MKIMTEKARRVFLAAEGVLFLVRCTSHLLSSCRIHESIYDSPSRESPIHPLDPMRSLRLQSADYLYDQAEEERSHFLKIFKYINDVGGTAITPFVGEVAQEYNSIKDVFEGALQGEIAVSNSINKIVAKCREANDYATEEFIMWFVKEQREEEANARRALELFESVRSAAKK